MRQLRAHDEVRHKRQGSLGLPPGRRRRRQLSADHFRAGGDEAGIRVTELVDKLSKDGFITLYVNFDTGKSTIKPDSAATLDSAAAALKAAADLKVEVAGHTDNVGRSEGGPAHRQRLRPDLACCRQPYQDGRAKNRRVELVKK